MDNPDLYAIIMAGGSGKRFWPASRKTRPKQFLRISGALPLLSETRQRLEGLIPAERILVVTTADLADEVHGLLPELPAANVLVEPVGRNTGPAVALAALEVQRRNPNSVQVVLPADHVIRPVEAFHRSLRAAVAEAGELGTLVVFGIRPSHPATGFGYLEAGKMTREIDHMPVYKVRRFVEKPSLHRAQEFLFQGSFFWNAGIFVWRTEAICQAIADFMPPVHTGLSAARTPIELTRIYSELPAESVDVAIMERAPNVRMLPVDYFWSDIGSWDALASVLPQDDAGNVVSGGAKALFEDARGCIVHSDPGQMIAVLGLHNVVIVHAGGATLVCDRENAQNVRTLVERLAQEGPEFQ